MEMIKGPTFKGEKDMPGIGERIIYCYSWKIYLQEFIVNCFTLVNLLYTSIILHFRQIYYQNALSLF